MRSGPELVRASNPYAKEVPATTWRLLLTTLALYFTAFSAVILVDNVAVRGAGAVLLGLLMIRIFIFYHDHLHGALLNNTRLGSAIMRAFGWWIMAGWSVWRQTHDYHHKNTAKMVGASIGSYPIVTVDMWRNITPAQRRMYKAARHPMTILFGYITVFILGMCISAFRRAPRQHVDGLIALLVHFGGVGLVGWFFGWQAALFAVVLPQFIACALGSYLFYAQHNFPGMQIRGRQDWEYSFAALRSSSMFNMGPVMHWFTGNIGYHHVHHLNHRIPFYRLPEAMAGIPELQDPCRTSWRPSDVMAALALKIWDPAQGKMISYEEADGGPMPDGGLVSAK